MLLFFILTSCIAGVFGNVIKIKNKQTETRIWAKMVREENLKSDLRTERESYGVEEKRVISGEIQTVIRFSPLFLKYLQHWLKSQRTNHPNMWMLLHTEHFPLCLQPVVPLMLRAWSLSMQALTCPARSHLTVLINTHYTGLSLFALINS